MKREPMVSARVPIAIVGDENGDDFPIYDGYRYRFSWGDGRTQGRFTGHTDRARSTRDSIWFWEDEGNEDYVSLDPRHIRAIEALS